MVARNQQSCIQDNTNLATKSGYLVLDFLIRLPLLPLCLPLLVPGSPPGGILFRHRFGFGATAEVLLDNAALAANCPIVVALISACFPRHA